MPSNTFKSRYHEVASQIADLVEAKNKAYGNSVKTSAQALALLFPDGLPPDRYEFALTFARQWDKFMRLAHDPNAFGEQPHADLCGYSLRAIVHAETRAASLKAPTSPRAQVPEFSEVQSKQPTPEVVSKSEAQDLRRNAPESEVERNSRWLRLHAEGKCPLCERECTGNYCCHECWDKNGGLLGTKGNTPILVALKEILSDAGRA